MYFWTMVSVMTNGGPFGSSSVLAYQMFEQSIFSYRFGYGAAIASVLFVIMWFAQTMRVFFVGDVDTAARLADAVKLPEQHLGPVENLQRMSAGHKVKLIVSQQHLGSVTIGVLDSLQIEVGRDPAGIFEAAHGMIQRDKACRFKFPLNQGGEITNSATDVRDDKTAAQAVARQQFAFVPPCRQRMPG